MSALSAEEIEAALVGLDGWVFDGERIRKEFTFGTFLDAIAFINRIAAEAEEADHHPDLANHFRTVIVSFRSWDANGVTARDMRMAARVEASAGT